MLKAKVVEDEEKEEEEEEEEEDEEEEDEEGHEEDEEEEDDDGAWLDAGRSKTLSRAVPHDEAPSTKDKKSFPQPPIASQATSS